MTSLTERPTARISSRTAVPQAPRGGSYVTLPDGATASATEGTYVSLPQAAAASTRTQGHYVTLPAAFVEETELSYTRRG